MIDLADVIVLIKFIFLGFVQGFTEPIPVSSSGHIVIIKDLFGIYTPGLSFEIIVNFGSLLAILFVYRKDIITLCKETILFLIERNKKYHTSFLLSLYLLLATMITGVIGLTLENIISDKLTNSIFVGISLMITAAFIWAIRNLSGTKQEKDLTIKDAIIIGLAQSFALIPGISRSGATIVAAMFVGLKRELALKFSFLLYIPISVGINIVSFKKIMTDQVFINSITLYAIAFIVAIMTTYFALKWFMDVMMKGKLIIFTYYCVMIGSLIIIHQLFIV